LVQPFQFHSPKWLDMLKNHDGCQYQDFKSGHWVMVDAAKEFNAAALKFLGD
jgi:pimeloyl-ACP methyl ester carboxylesterase